MKFNSKFAVVLIVGALALVGCTPQANNNGTTPPPNPSDSNLGGGTAVKPSAWPASIPTLDGAYNFNYAQANGTYYLGYEIQTTQEIDKTTADVEAGLTSVGWVVDSQASAETSQGALRGLKKDTNVITLAVSKGDATNVHTIAIIMGPQTSSDNE